jgi:predicted permease
VCCAWKGGGNEVFLRLRVFLVRLRGLLGRERPGSELDEELQVHLSLLTERYIRQGMTPAEAALAARRQLGNATLLKESHREMRVFPSVESFWRALRYGVRQLRANPAFTAFAVLSLALGIGANTAVFTLLDQLVLRRLPVKDPERLVMIWTTGPHFGDNNGPRRVSYPMYEDFQRRAVAFESVFCRFETPVAVGVEGVTERVTAELVSGNYFQALGAGPAAGRVFSPEADDRFYKGHPVVVLSHRYWVEHFGADPAAVGRKILVTNYPMEIVGVAARGFTGADPSISPDLWIPIQMRPLVTPGADDLGNRLSQWIQVFARLKPGFTVASARASLQPLLRQILEQETASPGLSRLSPYDRERFLKRAALVESAATGYSDLRMGYSTALFVLMGMSGLILLAACSNVAGLLVARAVARQKEMAVRLSIGAARRTLIGHLMAESLLLSLAGAVLGLALSIGATRGLLSLLRATEATLTLRATPDWRILLFNTGVAFATALLFGLAPAFAATRLDLWTTLKDGGAVPGRGSAARFRKILVAAQVALSFLLLAAAGLFSRTLINLRNTPHGFKNIDRIVTFQLDPAKSGYSIVRTHQFCLDALREVRAIQGVKSAAFVSWPLLRGFQVDTFMHVEGHQEKDGEDMQAYYNAVSPGYWEAMGVPLLQGRDFEERDRMSPRDANRNPVDLVTVAIVNRAFSEHFFGQRSPIGRHLGFGGPDGKLIIRIVGLVENSLYGGPRRGVRRQVFLPYLQLNIPMPATFYVRTAEEPAALFPRLRNVVAKLDGSIPVYAMNTLAAQLDETLSTERLIAALATAFGGLATLMAALGLYGVMTFAVARRSKEIGLRVALGARQRSVLWLILRETLILFGAGLAAGVPCAYFLSRYISSQLFGVTPADVATCVGAIALLALVAAVSSFVPARRASAIDPLTALRYE